MANGESASGNGWDLFCEAEKNWSEARIDRDAALARESMLREAVRGLLHDGGAIAKERAVAALAYSDECVPALVAKRLLVRSGGCETK